MVEPHSEEEGPAPRDVPSWTLAVCQVPVDIDDPAGTEQAAAAALEEACRRGAALVVLPELLLSGYVFADRDEARRRAEPAEDGPTSRLVRRVAGSRAVVVAGFCERTPDGDVTNSALLVQDGRVRAVHRKTHLWGGVEKAVFTPGTRRSPVVDTPLGRIGLGICYEIEFPEWVRDLALRGADVVAAPSNWPCETPLLPDEVTEVVQARAAAAGSGVYLAVADRVGPERGVDWVGGSVVADPAGRRLTEPALGRAGVLLAEVDVRRARDKRRGHHN
uniref:nitrilase-related carbon-nitrogen hydrolase n=1 Tax=Desertihabitans aurantiacus TaxID=2282477 RepID=UPI000DF83072